MRFFHIHKNQVRLLARGHGADSVLHSKNPGPTDRGQLHHFFRLHYGRIPGENLVKICSRAHFTEEVEIVVACATVRSEPHIDAAAQHFRHRCHPCAQLHIAFGIVCNLDSVFRNQADLRRIQPNTMRRDRIFIQDVQFMEMFERFFPIP